MMMLTCEYFPCGETKISKAAKIIMTNAMECSKSQWHWLCRNSPVQIENEQLLAFAAAHMHESRPPL